MQRNVLIALVAVVVAAGVAATAAIVLDDGDDTVALISPSPSVTPGATSEVVTASPSPGTTPAATATPAGSATAGPAASPTPAPTITTKPGVTIRAAKSVDCEDEPKFCSAEEGVTLDDDRMVTSRSQPQTVAYTDVPTITMSSELRESNDSSAEASDPVASIHVEVDVNNKTQKTFVFAKREIVLEVFRNGRLYDSFATKGPGFEMTPGSKMTGTFDRPITDGGEYSWQAKVWYYEK